MEREGGGLTPDVDQRHERGDDAGEDTGVLRNMPFLVDSAEPFGKRQTVVAGEGEEVPRDGGEVDDIRRHIDAGDDDEHDRDPADGHGLAQDVERRVSRRVVQRIVQTGDVVAYRNERGEEEEEVDEVDGDHSFRDGFGRRPHFLAHVRGSVDTDLLADTRQLPDEDGEADTAPSAFVLEIGPDLRVRCCRGVDPDRDDVSEVRQYVHGEDGVLPVRKGSGAVDVAE